MARCQGYARGESTTRKRSEEGRERRFVVPSSRCAPPSPVEGRGCGGGEGAEQAEAEPEPEPEEQSSALDFEAILDRPKSGAPVVCERRWYKD